MKLEFLSAATDPWGAENSLFLIAEKLLAKGHSVRIVTRSLGVASFFGALPGAQVICLDHHGGRLSTLKVFAEYLRTERTSRDWISIVFSVDLAPLAVMDRVSIHSRRTWIYDVHDTPNKLQTRLVLTLCLMHFDLAICISRYAWNWGRGARKRIKVPRPIPLPGRTLPAPCATGERPVVGVIGRLHPDKNLMFAVDAFKAVRKPMQFAFIGAAFEASKEYAEELQLRATKELNSAVEFPGRLDVDEAFSRIDILFVANGAEPSGRTVGEAMVRGLPVVVPNSGGSLEYVEGTMAGLIYERDNVVSASTCLEQLVETQVRSEMGAEGRETILCFRTPEIVAEQYVDAISKIRGK